MVGCDEDRTFRTFGAFSMTVVPFTPRPRVPEHRRASGTPLEQARGEVVNRVAAAIHMANTEDMTSYPTWQAFVDGAYENVETNPKMLEAVSDTIRAARAAIAAVIPPEPCFDEDIAVAASNAVEAGGDAVIVISHVEAWLNEVLK